MSFWCWGTFVFVLCFFLSYISRKGRERRVLLPRYDGTQFIGSEATNSGQWGVIYSQEFLNKLRLHHKLVEWPELSLLTELIREKKEKEATVAILRETRSRGRAWATVLRVNLRTRKYSVWCCYQIQTSKGLVTDDQGSSQSHLAFSHRQLPGFASRIGHKLVKD